MDPMRMVLCGCWLAIVPMQRGWVRVRPPAALRRVRHARASANDARNSVRIVRERAGRELTILSLGGTATSDGSATGPADLRLS